MPRLHNEFQRLNNEILVVGTDYKQQQVELWNIQNEIDLKKIEFNEMEDEYHRIGKINNTNYEKLFDKILNIIREILGDQNTLLNGALIAIMRAIRKYPDATVISNFSALYLTMSSLVYDYNKMIMPGLIAEADSIYDDIFSGLVKKVISAMN